MSDLSATAPETSEPPREAVPMTEARRWAITVSIMAGTIMNTVDTTIANVALPHIQGSVQASQDQIAWVLTSYLIAAAIMTPLSAWLSERFGRKLVLLVSIGGFTVASALCGSANSLLEIVLYRVLQGAFGASLVPVSQAVLLDTYPPERHGRAMALWGQGAMVGPILGPILGGWLTDNYDWRWVFLINIPVGALAFFGIWTFLQDTRARNPKPFDFFGFTTLTFTVGGVQMMLDRGPSQDWFSSSEIWFYLILSGTSFYLFAIQTATAARPYFDRALLRDRNFMVATTIGFFVGVLLFSTMALLPMMMQTLLGYSVLTTGLVSVPRGIGSFLSMLVVGEMIARIDRRYILLIGMGVSGIAAWQMTHFNLQMDDQILVWSGVLQGMGVGFIFPPLSTLAFTTLSPSLRSEGAAVYNLVRSIGSAVGISLMQAHHQSSLHGAHSSVVQNLRPDAPNMQAYGQFDLSSQLGVALTEAMAERQAAMLTYVQDFQLLLLLTCMALPLVFLIRKPNAPPEGGVHAAVD